jgi:metal-dependent amidase/aminoacylase/carboxypeptidase family protein
MAAKSVDPKSADPKSVDPKSASRAIVEREGERLVALSHRIHAQPELKFEEEQSSAWTAGALADGGFPVDAGICDLPTAFSARVGSGPLHIAICAEYDALPVIGHACGHNIIASSAVGAAGARALAPLVDDLGITLSVIGTPAEEGGGGKILMLERGAFDGVHASLMVHPTPMEDLYPRVSAVAHMRVQYTGRESHAAIAPELGINAADAITVAQVAIGLLRQHLRPFDQIHGIVTHGGDATNVIPAHTEGTWMARSRTLGDLEQLVPRVSHAPDHRRVPALRAHGTRPRPRRDVPGERDCTWSTGIERRGGDVLDRHGQRVAGHAVDSPVHRDRNRRRGQPSTRVRRRRDQ